MTAWDISTATFTTSKLLTVVPFYAQGLFIRADGLKMYIISNENPDTSSINTVREYNLSTAWSISTASFVQSFNVTPNTNIPSGISFKPDGTKMFIGSASVGANRIMEYHLSTPWNISTASFFLPSINLTNLPPNETLLEDIFFRDDGLKVYMVGSATDKVHEFNLTTAWTIASPGLVYVQSFSVGVQDTFPDGIFFKPDGLKMFVAGSQNGRIYEYSLSTAWNISTAVFFQSFSTTAQFSFPYSVFFKPDGTKMFHNGTSFGSNSSIYEYSLTSPPIQIANPTFSPVAGTYNPIQSITISTTTAGSTIYYTIDGTTPTISSLTAQPIIVGATTTIKAFAHQAGNFIDSSVVTAVYTIINGWTIVNGGGEILINEPASPNLIKLINLNSGSGGRYAWRDNNTSFSGDIKLEFKVDYTSNVGISPELIVGFVDAIIHPQDPLTNSSRHVIRGEIEISIEGYCVLNGFVNGIGGHRQTTSGAKNQHAVWVYPNSNSPVSDSSLKGPYYVTVELKNNKLRLSVYKDQAKTQHMRGSPREVDATGINPQNLRYVAIGNGLLTNGVFSSSSRIFNGTVNDTIVTQGQPLEIIPSKPSPATGTFIEDWEGYFTGDQNPTPWISKTEINGGFDISTALYTNHILPFVTAGDLRGIAISADGTKFYAVGERVTKSLRQYTLTTPYDLSTAVLVQSIIITSLAFPQTGGLFFKPDGTKFFITFSGDDQVHQWTLSTPFNISTAIEGTPKCVRTPPNPCNGDGSQGTGSVTFSPDGTKMYVGNYILPSDQLTQWTLSTPWDVSTAIFVGVFGPEFPPFGRSPRAQVFNSNGTKMWIMASEGGRIDEYGLPVPFDITTAIWNQNYFDTPFGNFAYGFTFSNDGLKMYINDTTSVYEYSLAPSGVVPITDIHEVSTSNPIDGVKAFKIDQKYNNVNTAFPWGRTSVSRFIPAIVRTDGSGLDIPISLSTSMRASVLSSFSSPVGVMVGYEFISGAPIGNTVGLPFIETSERGILFKLYGTAGASKVYIWNGIEWIHNNTLDIPISLTNTVGTVAEINNVNLKNVLDISATLSNIYGIDFESHVTGMWIGYVGLNRATSFVDTEVLINADSSSLVNAGTKIKTFKVRANLTQPIPKTFKISAKLIGSKTFTINAHIPPIPAKIRVSARIVRRTAVNNMTPSVILVLSTGTAVDKTFLIDAHILQPSLKTFTIDARKVNRKTKTYLIDAKLIRIKTFKIDAEIGSAGEPQSILNVESTIGFKGVGHGV